MPLDYNGVARKRRVIVFTQRGKPYPSEFGCMDGPSTIFSGSCRCKTSANNYWFSFGRGPGVKGPAGLLEGEGTVN